MNQDTCRWDENGAKLIGNRMSKVRRYLREGLIKRQEDGNFIVHPYPGLYQTHIVNMKLRSCTCQHNNTKGTDCSHIMACDLAMHQEAKGERNIQEE